MGLAPPSLNQTNIPEDNYSFWADSIAFSRRSTRETFDAQAWERQQLPVPRTWPVLDEEYLEWADVLKSALEAAEHGRPLRVATGIPGTGDWRWSEASKVGKKVGLRLKHAA